jgi:hypothetical protein
MFIANDSCKICSSGGAQCVLFKEAKYFAPPASELFWRGFINIVPLDQDQKLTCLRVSPALPRSVRYRFEHSKGRCKAGGRRVPIVVSGESLR